MTASRRLRSLVVSCAVLGLAVSASRAAEAVARVTSVFKQVKILSAGAGQDWRVAEVGEELFLADEIRTGQRGRARVEFLDRYQDRNSGPSVINVASDSLIKIEDFYRDPQDTRKNRGFIDLVRGAIRVFSKGWGGDSMFTVRTGTSLCGIRGSEEFVAFRGVVGGVEQPVTQSCLSGSCFTDPIGSFAGQRRPLDVGFQRLMPSQDPATWRDVRLTEGQRQGQVGESGVPGVSDRMTEELRHLERFGPGPRGEAPREEDIEPIEVIREEGVLERLGRRGPTGGGVVRPPSPAQQMGILSSRIGNVGEGAGGPVSRTEQPSALRRGPGPRLGPPGGTKRTTVGSGRPGPAAGADSVARLALEEFSRYELAKRILAALGRAIVDGDVKGFTDCFSRNANQDVSIFRNGFLDDLKRDTNINLDFELQEYRMTRDTLTIVITWLRNAVDQETGASQVVQRERVRVLFDRHDGMRILAWLGASPFGVRDTATQAQAAAGDQNVSGGPYKEFRQAFTMTLSDSYMGYNPADKAHIFFDAEAQVAHGDVPGHNNDFAGGANSRIGATNQAFDFTISFGSIPHGWLVLTNMGHAVVSGSPNTAGMSHLPRIAPCSSVSSFDDLRAVNYPDSNFDAFQSTSVGTGSGTAYYAFKTGDGNFGFLEVHYGMAPVSGWGGTETPFNGKIAVRLASQAGSMVVNPSGTVDCP